MFFGKKHKKIDFLKAHEGFGDLIEKLHRHQKNKGRKTLVVFLKYLAVFSLVIFVLAALGAGFLAYRFKAFYDLALIGKSSLENSIAAGKQKDFGGMAADSVRAENAFSELASELAAWRGNILFKGLKIGEQEFNDIDYIVKSAGIISRALNRAAVIGDQFDKLLGGKFGASFSEFTPAQKQSLLKFVYESGPELNGAKADLELAMLTMDNVRGGGLLSPFKGKINEAKEKLKQGSILASQAVLASELAPGFLGYPQESTFLVLFQNNDELRPTGGFLGTYAILQMKDGDIVRFDSHDIYHMDAPMEAGRLLTIVPPEPIKKYLNKNWYMRDSNWSPDWPAAAAQITWFYKKENALLPPKNQINDFSGDFTGVIAITPDFVESLLEMIGPIAVRGERFDRHNFTELLQYKVEQDFVAQNISSWQRKEIVGDILAELKTKIFNLNYNQWPAVFDKVAAAISKKDILVFLKDEYAEGLAKRMGMGGEIKQFDGDYLFLVDANMAALKTDAVMQRTISYQVAQKTGGLYADLKISYANGGVKNWKTGDYKSYTRIYLPEGSRLISAEGFIYEKAKVYDEAGKTVIAGFISVPLGRSFDLSIKYELPKNLLADFRAGTYSLYIQKQPGNRIKSVKVDVTAADAIKSYNPLTAVRAGENKIVWSSDLATDKEFKLMMNDY